MGGRGSEFKCHGECQIDWRQLWEQACCRTPDQSAFDATAVNTWSSFRHRRGSAESVGQSHLVFNPRVQSIQFWIVLVVAVAV
jgi:hypothetical protein